MLRGSFASTSGRWHLIGRWSSRDAMRWFAATRIERADVTKAAYGGHTAREVGMPPQNARPVHG
jgi:hypothetical protein